MVSKPDRPSSDRAASAGYGYSGGSKSSPKGLGTAANSKDRSFDKGVQKAQQATFNPGLKRGHNMPYTKEQQRELRGRLEKQQKQQNIERFKDAIRTPPPGMVPPKKSQQSPTAATERAINRAYRDMQDQERRRSQPKASPPASKTPPSLNVEPERPPSKFRGMAPMSGLQQRLEGREVDLHSRSRLSESQRESMRRRGR